MRDDTARAIAEIGIPISPEMIAASQDLYQTRHETEPYRDAIVTRDERYGSHERQRLDVFQPAGGGGKRPVLIFVHGGGFVAGDKRVGNTAYYDNVGVWAVRNGYVGVTMTYRLAPENVYPAGAADVGGAVKWATENIASFGGDPERIVLFGQSAGSTHVATYGARPELHARSGGGVRAIAMLSGVYDFTLHAHLEVARNARAYLGGAPNAAAAGSALPAIATAGIPLLFGISEFDPPMFHEQAKALTDAIFAHTNRFPNVLFLPRHNHISQIAHLNAGTDDRLLADRLTEFINVNTNML
ncbi:MAG TPA: alpha/beta hydrolase [Candidatus Aquilonibacter sp.]